MTAIGVIRQPVGRNFTPKCLPCCWHAALWARPQFLTITPRNGIYQADGANTGGNCYGLGAQISGRSFYAEYAYGFTAAQYTSCGTVDPYIFVSGWFGSSPSHPVLYIDIWKAYIDGIWSSSVTVDIYADIAGGSEAVRVGNQSDTCPSDVTKNISAVSSIYTCPTVKRCTVTVNDDGSFTVV